MFTRIVHRSTGWLSELFDELEYDPEGARRGRQVVLLVLAGLGLAAVLVTLTTLTALGLDALLHASLALPSDL